MKPSNGNHRLRALIIDDSPEDEELIVRELKRAGYRVVAERVHTEAGMLRALAEETWDIVLCDFKMPRFSPFRALEIMKVRPLQVPFIVISGVIDEFGAVDILKAGAHNFVTKGNLSRLPWVIKKEIEAMAERMQYRLDLQESWDLTIEAWGKALELRDRHTSGHTQRVTDLTLRLATRAGIMGEKLMHLHRGALLHDVGKMGIPDLVLLKRDVLSPDERKTMEMHPQLAFEMLWPIPFLRSALDIPYCHHERWDGSGYPRGLKGEEIPFEARLFAVVDVFDALTSDRPYRRSWTNEKAIDYIKTQSGTLFDAAVVDSFLAILAEIGNHNGS
jgi:response regulator RpfG family c-di-GMP phosphodiesterase